MDGAILGQAIIDNEIFSGLIDIETRRLGILNGDRDPVSEIDFMIQELCDMVGNRKKHWDSLFAFKGRRVL
ncbi:hypothetical protein RFN30_23105 [Mesorhizobium sp. VK23D]|nr:hypothetical protein [Mesorhizobium sp. VK23D]